MRLVQSFKKMPYLAVIFSVFTLCALTVSMHGEAAAGHDVAALSGEDAALTHQALLAVQKKQWGSAERQIARTRNPLSAKLFYWLKYTEGAGDVQFNRLAAFIRANPDWPSQGTLQLRAEKNMPRDLSDRAVIAWFSDYAPRTPDGMNRYLSALKNTGRTAELEKQARHWWRETLLTPAQQVDFLRAYGAMLDRDSHIRRLDTLLFAEHYTNARSLAMLLGGGYPALADARIALSEDKSGIDHLIAKVPGVLKDDPGLAFERLRWRRRHDLDYRAMEILHRPPPVEKISNPADWWRERHIIARRLMEEKHYKSAYLLVSEHMQEEGLPFAQAEFLAGFLALRFLDEPWRAFEHFEALYHRTKTPLSRARGAYWAARASEALKYDEIAQHWYQVAARYPTAYYGQQAQKYLQIAYREPERVPPQGSEPGRSAFEGKEMVQMARILQNANMWEEVTDFLNALARQTQTPEEYLYVADLARELKHYHNAIAIAKQGLGRNIFLMDHAYPTLLSYMKGIDADWALVHGVIRQESAFNQKAVSPAGARGLMQLMPATARDVARKEGVSHATEWLTNNPAHNIRLGAGYLTQMLERYDGSYPLAVAAYNGGPGRVDRWLKEWGDPRKGGIAMEDWMELIPVYETRNYVQRVLEGAYVYHVKLGDVQRKSGYTTALYTPAY